jgi:hypothetical protein
VVVGDQIALGTDEEPRSLGFDRLWLLLLREREGKRHAVHARRLMLGDVVDFEVHRDRHHGGLHDFHQRGEALDGLEILLDLRCRVQGLIVGEGGMQRNHRQGGSGEEHGGEGRDPLRPASCELGCHSDFPSWFADDVSAVSCR